LVHLERERPVKPCADNLLNREFWLAGRGRVPWVSFGDTVVKDILNKCCFLPAEILGGSSYQNTAVRASLSHTKTHTTERERERKREKEREKERERERERAAAVYQECF
jgi:hypothetical protein